MPQSLSVLSHDADTTRRPSGEMATHLTYNAHTSTQSTADAATHAIGVPFQRRHALAGLDVPDLERVVLRPRHDAPPVRKHGNTIDLRRTHINTKVPWTPQRTMSKCPSSVATHLPVATSDTSSVLPCDPDTTRRPSGNTATQRTYTEARSSPQKYRGRRNALSKVAFPASPRIYRSPRPTP